METILTEMNMLRGRLSLQVLQRPLRNQSSSFVSMRPSPARAIACLLTGDVCWDVLSLHLPRTVNETAEEIHNSCYTCPFAHYIFLQSVKLHSLCQIISNFLHSPMFK